MTRLPQAKPRAVVKVLEKLGFRITRITGSHARLIHPDGRKVTVSLHNEPIPKGTLKAILRQAQITKEELIEHL